MTPRRNLRSSRGLRTDALIAVGLFLLIGLLIQEWSSQPASRYLLTVAAVDDRTLELDSYDHLLGLDKATYRGHVYSDKAPYQPLLVAPAYQAFRLLGGDPFPGAGDPELDEVLDGTHRGLWWVTLWSSTIPAIALTILMRRTVARSHPRWATSVALAMTVSTVILPFSSWLFAHVLAALFVMAAWTILRRSDSSAAAVAGAGLCLGLAIGTEYSLAAVALVFLITVALERSPRRVAALCLGTVAATLPLLLYNYLVFEDPFEVSYQGHLANFQGDGALGVYNLTAPRLEEVQRALVGGRGLFVLNPIMLLAFGGCALAITRATRLRRDAWVALASFSVMLALTTGIDGIGGDSPGPRYLIPVLPLLALPLAEAWQRLPVACAGAALIGASFMIVATVTGPLEPDLQTWLRRLSDGELVTNVLTGDDHRWLVLAAAVTGLGVLGWSIVDARRPDRTTGPVGLAADPASIATAASDRPLR